MVWLYTGMDKWNSPSASTGLSCKVSCISLGLWSMLYVTSSLSTTTIWLRCWPMETGSCTREISARKIRCLGELTSDLSCSHSVGGNVTASWLADSVPSRADRFTLPIKWLRRCRPANESFRDDIEVRNDLHQWAILRPWYAYLRWNIHWLPLLTRHPINHESSRDRICYHASAVLPKMCYWYSNITKTWQNLELALRDSRKCSIM